MGVLRLLAAHRYRGCTTSNAGATDPAAGAYFWALTLST